MIQHPDRAPAANLDRHRRVRGQRHRRQCVQMPSFLGQLFAEQGVVLALDHLAHPALILFNAGKVVASAQHQHLRQNRLGTSMGLLDHAVLVSFARKDPG